MSAEKLAFLQNFYTDVTLYMPPEPAAASRAPAEAAPVAVAASGAVAAPGAAPMPLAAAVTDAPAVGAQTTVSPAAAAVAQPLMPPPAAAPGGAVAPPVPVPPARLPAAALGPPVAPAPAAPAVPPAQLTPFSTQGQRADGVVLLVRLPPDQFRKLHRNVFLNKMLQALNLVMNDVVLVNVESHLPVALNSLRRELAATQIVAFGRNLLDVAVRNTQIYEPVQFPAHGLSYLAAAEVEMIEYDVSLKKRLWPGLKSMFLH